jgi:PhnB protein
MTKPIPDGFHTLTPHLIVEGAAKAIEFYKKAFGAEELVRMPTPDGKRLMHAQVKIGDSMVMLVDAMPEYGAKGPQALGGTPCTLHLYSKDVNAAFDRALKAGCTATMPLADQFWGDRYGKLKDPFGHEWSLAQHVRDVPPAELQKAAQQAMGRQPGAKA